MSHLHAVPARQLRQAGVDPNTGELDEGMPSTLEEAWDMIRGLSRRFASACGQITRLQNELEGKRLAEIEAKKVQEVLEYWRPLCKPKAEIVAGSPRWEKVRQRLQDKIVGRPPWTVEELKHCVDAAVADPWLNGTHPKSKGYLEAQTIFRDADQVERLLRQDEVPTSTPLRVVDPSKELREAFLAHPGALMASKHGDPVRATGFCMECALEHREGIGTLDDGVLRCSNGCSHDVQAKALLDWYRHSGLVRCSECGQRKKAA